MLNDLFSRFDMLVESYDLNKVKTIGDCYMVVRHTIVACSHASVPNLLNSSVFRFDNTRPLYRTVNWSMTVVHVYVTLIWIY